MWRECVCVLILIFGVQGRIKCISDPVIFWDTFHHPQDPNEIPCVDASLMATIQGPCECSLNDFQACSPYLSTYSTSALAWISGSDALESYIRSSWLYPNDTWAAVSNMLTTIGYTNEDIDSRCTYRLAIFNRSIADQEGLFVPTFNRWFHELRLRFDLNFQPSVIKELSLHDFQSFYELTGCNVGCTSCNEDFENVLSITYPALFEGGTIPCARAFSTEFDGGLKANAVHARALLFSCFGANELNTGNGYGFDGQDYTVAEFMVENELLDMTMGAAVYTLNEGL
ncbi:uncharacterized protein LOC131890964 isoform X1 [Tigriopus californicus]|uniref:uncharacterized protein LOC131890964 isoform X1 n=1 Tax=Tigriopus californicus TaxID=6832 RepID=UPI0027DAB2B0|nr:uncharacterized protein LOC131890964 isoform X1 [Tigriopus californicus]